MPYYAQNSLQSRKRKCRFSVLSYLTIVDIIFLWHSFDQRFGEIVDDINRGFTNLAKAERMATYERVSNLECKPSIPTLTQIFSKWIARQIEVSCSS